MDVGYDDKQESSLNVAIEIEGRPAESKGKRVWSEKKCLIEAGG